MRPVCFDLRGLQPGYKAHLGRGLGRLCQGLAAHLPAQVGDLPLVGLIQRGLDPPGPEHLAGCARLALPQPLPRVKGMVRLLGQEIIGPFFLRNKVGLVHFMAHLDAPAWPSVPMVVTVPDLIMARGAGRLTGGGPHRRLLRALEAQAARRASRVLAISTYTAGETVDYLGVSPERVRVIPLAASKEFQPVEGPQRLEAIKTRYGLTRPFFLVVGGFDPRKNLPRLVRAFSRFLRAGQKNEVDLVLTGSTADEGQVAPTLKAISEEGLGDRVRLTGLVPDEDLPGLYSLAVALLFPSLYEGFGLPALEAMACGCPVAVAQASSLPEVVGRAGIYFDPHSEEEMAQAMARLLAEEGLRENLCALGLAQAAGFSWERTAALVVAAYREVYAETAGY